MSQVRVRLLLGYLTGDYLPHDVAEGQVGCLLRMVDDTQALVQFPQGPRFVYRAFLVSHGRERR
ncbi:MAG: hypothetical protein Q8O40_11840 [Chloroflexota bacterium]|nr:hypothetical protein [Chloroflexota bacterium]